jgi:hypothetical protein
MAGVAEGNNNKRCLQKARAGVWVVGFAIHPARYREALAGSLLAKFSLMMKQWSCESMEYNEKFSFHETIVPCSSCLPLWSYFSLSCSLAFDRTTLEERQGMVSVGF